MITLPIKKKWFDMILGGEKTEEYREVKPYWTTRLCNELGIENNMIELTKFITTCNYITKDYKNFDVIIRNGYSKDSIEIHASCHIKISDGKEEWGAVKGQIYYVFMIDKINFFKL